MAISTLTTKGRVTIPRSVRDRLGLRPGDRLDFRVDGAGRILVRPLVDSSLAEVSGVLRHLAKEKPVTVEDMKAAALRPRGPSSRGENGS